MRVSVLFAVRREWFGTVRLWFLGSGSGSCAEVLRADVRCAKDRMPTYRSYLPGTREVGWMDGHAMTALEPVFECSRKRDGRMQDELNCFLGRVRGGL